MHKKLLTAILICLLATTLVPAGALAFTDGENARAQKVDTGLSELIKSTKRIVSIAPKTQPKKRIDVAGASRNNGTNIQAYSANDTLAQKFLLDSVGENTCTIQNINSGHYLSVTKGNVIQRKKSKTGVTDSQKWQLEWVSGGIKLINVDTKKAMTITSGGLDGHDIKTAKKSNSKNQVFNLLPVSSLAADTYTITSYGNKVIDARNGRAEIKTNIQVWSSNNGANQKWHLKSEGDGYFSIRCVRSGYAIDIEDVKTNGSNVRLWKLVKDSSQLWEIIPSGDGWFYIKSKSGMYLSAAGGGRANGQNVRAAKSPYKFRFDVTSYAGKTDILSNINYAKGSKQITAFGGYAPSSNAKKKLQSALSSIQTRGYSVGFMMVDLTTGQGVTYNADQSFYSASTIKGPYVASVVSSKPSSVLTWRSTMQATIRQSSNNGYESLRTAFGPSPMQKWCESVGIPSSVGSNWYTNYSTRTLTKLWLQNYSFFTSGKQNAKLCQSWFTSSFNSTIYATLGKKYYMNTKPGWIGGGLRAANDAGIVWGDKGPYLITILTNAPGNVGIMSSLVSAVDNAHNEML